MTKLHTALLPCLPVMAIAMALGTTVVAAKPVDAVPRCTIKTANGTGPTQDVAKFQVYEGFVRAVNDGLWTTWMATGTTPGYQVGKPVYVCRSGMGLGVSCSGRAKICKT